MPREINVPGWSDVARAIFGYVEASALGIEDFIRAVGVIESDRPEWGFTKQERRWMTQNLSSALLAANFSFLAIRNPVDSGVLVIVDHFINTGAQTCIFKRRVLPDATFEAGIVSEVVVGTGIDLREYRSGVEPNHAGRLIAGRSVGLPPTPSGFSTGGGGTTVDNMAYRGKSFYPLAILAPGSYLAAEAINIAQTISGLFIGRDRPLHKGVRG